MYVYQPRYLLTKLHCICEMFRILITYVRMYYACNSDFQNHPAINDCPSMYGLVDRSP